MTLFNSEKHEPLNSTRWDVDVVTEAIQQIVNATVAAFDAAGFWPIHPAEAGADLIKPHTRKGLYHGASGVLWALHYLQREQIVCIPIDLPAAIRNVHGEFMRNPDSKSGAPGLMAGETGVLLAMRVIDPQPWIDDRLHEIIQNNTENEALELFWGAPGTMLAALWMYRWSNEERWKQLYVRNAHSLVDRWNSEIQPGVFVWTQQLYGNVRQYLGAAHGFAGNVGALLRGFDLLDYEIGQDEGREADLARAPAVTDHVEHPLVREVGLDVVDVLQIADLALTISDRRRPVA